MTSQASVTALVRGAARRWTLSRSGEALLLGLAAALATAAAALLSGATEIDGHVLAAAALSGAACAASWAWEHRRSRRELARRVDRRLGREGELLTAWECEDRGAASTVERALVARTAGGLGPDAVGRAVSPPSIVFVAAPLFAAACLLWALEQRPTAPTAGVRAVRRALLTSSASASDQPALAAELERLAAELARAPADPSRELARARQSLAGLAAEAEPGGEPARGLRRALDLTDEVLRELGGFESVTGSAAGAEGSRSTLANAAGSRTMSGPPGPAGRSADPPGAPGAIPEVPGTRRASAAATGTTSAGRWWPARHDAVVAAWVARRPGAESND